MFDLCENLAKGMSDPLFTKPPRYPDKAGIEEFKKYLKDRGVKYDFLRDGNWYKITSYRKLRNKFVHSNTHPSKELDDDEKTKESIKGNKYLLIDEEQKIVILNGFCQEAINVVHQFLTSITDSAGKWYQSQPIEHCKTIDMAELSKNIHRRDTKEQPDPWHGEHPH